jgi:ribosomal protein S7
VGLTLLFGGLSAQHKYATYLPHTAGRYQTRRFRKATVRRQKLPPLPPLRSSEPLPAFGPSTRVLVRLCGSRDRAWLTGPDCALVQCPIVERLTNALMYNGRNNGKKLLAVRIIKHTLEIIHLTTDQNPIQVLVNAIMNSGCREDSTRIGSGGVVRRQAVDCSPLRRVNQAIYLLTIGVRAASATGLACVRRASAQSCPQRQLGPRSASRTYC